jgi:limonene-1,2-epoxide hydrolase
VVYQVGNATVNQATVDAGIEEIATTTWAGFGTDLKELTGADRDKAISVFGGILNAGTSITANSNATATLSAEAQAYHPYGSMNVAGSVATNAFIKNRLSTIEFHHKATAGAADEKFTFPVTALSFDYNNNITYLTPEELSTLNSPIGQFTGTRAVTGSASMYLRSDDLESAGFLRNISQDTRTSSAQTSNANLIIGGTTAPYVAFQMDAVQFEFPTLATEDVISMSVNFVAQEPTATKGDGGEITIFAKKS